MSLMFAALQRMSAPAGVDAPVPVPAPGRQARRWLGPAAALGAALALVLGWTWVGSEPALASPALEAATPVAAQAAVTAPARARVEANTPIEPVQSPMETAQVPEPASVAPTPLAPAAPAMPIAPAATAAPATPAGPTAPAALVAEVSVRDASSVEAPEDGDVARRVADIGAAIHAGELPRAGAGLAELETMLPPRSLTLLRMQAWLAHERGDVASALALYRRILERVPGDQTAAINLAILEAAHGNGASARQRLRRLRADDSESRAIEHAIGMVEAELR